MSNLILRIDDFIKKPEVRRYYPDTLFATFTIANGTKLSMLNFEDTFIYNEVEYTIREVEPSRLQGVEILTIKALPPQINN